MSQKERDCLKFHGPHFPDIMGGRGRREIYYCREPLLDNILILYNTPFPPYGYGGRLHLTHRFKIDEDT